LPRLRKILNGVGWEGFAELVHSGSVLLGEDAEIGHQLVGGGEAIDIDDLGGEHRSRGIADTGDRCDWAGDWQSVVGLDQEFFETVLGGPALLELADQGANQFFGHFSGECANAALGQGAERIGFFQAQMRNGHERCILGPAEFVGCGVLLQQVEHPSGGQIRNDAGQFREHPG